MKLSTREEYGLMAMAELARYYGEGPVSLAAVAEAQGVSLSYLEQIVAPLRRAGLLESTRGAYGGYALAREPESITVGDVIRALEGSILPLKCLGTRTDCHREETCMVSNVWRKVHESMTETLDSITLADLHQGT